MARTKEWVTLPPKKARELLTVERLTSDHKLAEMLTELGMKPITLWKAMNGRLVPKRAADTCLDYLERLGFDP